MIYAILMLSIIIVSLICFNTYQFALLRGEVYDLHNHDSERETDVPEEVADEQNSTDEEIIQRRVEFSERIARIKDELAKQQTPRHTGSIAQELHPGVTNLPHNTIAEEHSRIPDIEYAD